MTRATDTAPPAAPAVRQARTADLRPAELRAIRRLLDEAFVDDELGGFGDDDWDHALGGRHFLVEVEGDVISHGSIVERELRVAGRPLRSGYVEAVATRPDRQRLGAGTAVMRAVGEHLSMAGFELGALGTGSHGFYERLGWETWRGPSSVRTADGERRTPDDDGYILVLRTPATPTDLDLDAPISCDWRPGDVW